MRLTRFAPLVVLAVVAGCDFSPALDIDLPEHQPAAVISTVLAADSVVVVRLSVSQNPYVTQTSDRYGPPETRTDAVVTLLRDGQLVERLQVRSETCDGEYDPATQAPAPYECGPFAGTVPVRAGGTYTLRAEIPGLGPAEGTVTIPTPPTVTVTEDTRPDERRRFRIRVQDPAGRGDRYGVALIEGPFPEVITECDYRTNPPVCTERTVTRRQAGFFTSTDPAILAAGRDFELDNSFYRFISVTDDSFNGRTWDFTISHGGSQYSGGGDERNVLTVQIAALSGDVYDAYQISNFGGQDQENPFTEPVNLPSNVTGGYGLVGAVALAEVRVEATQARR